MRRIFLCLLFALPAAGRAGGLPAQFLSQQVNGAGITVLKAAPAYAELSARVKSEKVAEACASPGQAEMPVAVELPGSGELWKCAEGKAVRLDAWSDAAMQPGPGVKKAGRWFASIGMQSMGGGDYPASTLNMRVGSTLFKGRYDLALTYDYYKPRDSELTSSSLGLVGRALMPLSRHTGWNVGAQISTADNYGKKEKELGLVAGLSVYLPRGSFDITLNLKEKGNCGLLAGYTVYLSR